MRKFRTLAVFTYPSEALILEGRLKAEGIPVFLRDHNTLYADPMVSNAIGGVKMDVYVEDLIRAQAIARQINPELFNGEILCPKCKSPRYEYRFTFKNFLRRLFPFSRKMEYRCANCGNEYTS